MAPTILAVCCVCVFVCVCLCAVAVPEVDYSLDNGISPPPPPPSLPLPPPLSPNSPHRPHQSTTPQSSQSTDNEDKDTLSTTPVSSNISSLIVHYMYLLLQPWYRHADDLLDKLRSNENSAPFLFPVDTNIYTVSYCLCPN